MSITTVFMLVYGDYPELHRNVLGPMLQNNREQDVRLWLNAVCPKTLDLLLNDAPKNWTLYVNSENTPKYKVMWKLFNDPLNPITTPWITWFDDDIVTEPDWLPAAEQFINANPQTALFGAQFWRPHLAGVEHWIRKARWYSHKPFQQVRRHGAHGIKFIRGSYWWLPTFIMHYLDWPDYRLSHNGGDTALSEAILQLGLIQKNFHAGTSVDFEPRRGYSELPAGCARGRRKTDGKVASLLGDTAAYDERLKQYDVSYIELTDTVRLICDTVTMPPELTNWGVRPVQAHAPKLKPLRASVVRQIRSVQSRTRRKSMVASPGQKTIAATSKRTSSLPLLLPVPRSDRKQITTSYLSRKVQSVSKIPRTATPSNRARAAGGKTLKTLLSERKRRGRSI